MLKTMRNNTKIVLWVVIAAFLGTIVFAWGMQYTASEKMRNYVAKVNGREISSQEYDFYYDRAQRQWEQQNPNAEATEDLRLRFHQQAWNDLVREVLQQQEMQRFGIRVSDAEVVEFLQKYYYAVPEIMQVTAFQTNGQFDYNKYIGLMNSKDPQAGAFWAQIEALVRPQLFEFKLSNALFSTVRITEQDIDRQYREYHEYYRVKILAVRSAQFRARLSAVGEPKLKEEFEKNKDRYVQPERAAVKSVSFSKSSGVEDEQFAEDEALKIRDEAAAARDSGAFAEAAKKYSDDPTVGSNGGDLGWFGRGQMVAAFDSAVFAMKPGELSQPVRTSFGWHLIKLWGKKKDKSGEQVHAGHILIKVEPNREVFDRARTAAEEFQRAALEEGFEKAASARNLKIDSSNIFTREASITTLGVVPEVSRFIFSKKPGAISPVYNLPEGFTVVKVDQRLAAGLPEFVHIKSAVRSDILRRESRELARQKAQTIWRQVQGGASIDTAAAVHSERVVNELIWGWGAWVPEMGDAPAFLGAVIRAHEKKERLIPPVPVDNDFFIGELLEYIPYDSAKFAAARDSTAQFLLQKRRTDAYNTWIVDLQRKADIEDYRMEVLGANF